MNPTIFRKYDIRGIAADDLTQEVVERIGSAYGTMLIQTLGHRAAVAVGRDARESSDRLFEALSRGLHRVGIDVVELGMVPTPLAYFAFFSSDDIEGAIQITGSHNPAEYNGFKMMIGKQTLHGAYIQDLYNIAKDELFELAETHGQTRKMEDIIERYSQWVVENIEPGQRALKVVIDSGNGVGGLVAPELVRRRFAGEVIELFSEPDASFPNHHPDPTVEKNLQHLIEAVREHGADLGVAYDGDGDRIGVVDERGEIIWGDRLLILLSRDVLGNHPGATIIGEVKCSQTLFDDIEKHGGVPVMSAVGHSLIKAKIKETGAHLAGEMSGHIFFNDRFFGFDDAVYATCRVLEILSSTDQTLSQLMSDVPQTFATPEIRQDCPESTKFLIPPTVAEVFADRFETNTIDGVRVRFEHGWGLVRASNTQPVLVIRTEATSPELRDQYLQQLQDAIAQASAQLDA